MALFRKFAEGESSFSYVGIGYDRESAATEVTGAVDYINITELQAVLFSASDKEILGVLIQLTQEEEATGKISQPRYQEIQYLLHESYGIQLPNWPIDSEV